MFEGIFAARVKPKEAGPVVIDVGQIRPTDPDVLEAMRIQQVLAGAQRKLLSNQPVGEVNLFSLLVKNPKTGVMEKRFLILDMTEPNDRRLIDVIGTKLGNKVAEPEKIRPYLESLIMQGIENEEQLKNE